MRDIVMLRNLPKTLLLVAFALILILTLSLYLQLELSTPTGLYAVGQTVLRWVDRSRPETLTDTPDDVREVMAVLWYPAERGAGTTTSPYFPGLRAVSKALVESGEVEAWQVSALRFVRSHNLLDAKVLKENAPYPVLVFSPGNGTNVEFYNILLSEIASHGYIVVGLNHPYDVAAVEASDQHVLKYDKEQDFIDRAANEKYIAGRIQVRTQDVIFVLGQLELLNSDTKSPFAGAMDLNALAVGGHSLGGITASEACKADARFRACFNLDGIQRGGPFSIEEAATPPQQPFLFLTKEPQLPPRLIEKFESIRESYLVVVHGATHQSFSDGPILQPGLLPGKNQADKIMSLVQEYTLAFLDQTLTGQPSTPLSRSADLEDVSVNVFSPH